MKYKLLYSKTRIQSDSKYKIFAKSRNLRASLHGGGGPQVGEVRIPLRWDNPPVHITSHFNLISFTRQDKTRQCFIWSLIRSYVHRLYPNNLKS